jgi:H+-transporting ATPase
MRTPETTQRQRNPHMVKSIDSPQVESLTVEEVNRRLESSDKGLSTTEAEKRLGEFGRNTLEEKKVSPLTRFLGYFWGPVPWMIEVAAILSGVVRHWDDFVIILVLLVFNAVVGFWQEFKAANALEALKHQLALRARTLRNGQWQEIDAAELVPGDVIRLRLGDIIPADAKLMEGDYLSVDQSALTGESLPVDQKAGEIAYSGSVAKQGEMIALVTATGGDIFFGRTARLAQRAGAPSHFQKAVLAIGDYLIYLSLGLVAILIIVQLFRGAPLLELAQFALILTVASIPVAMPAVLSATMAVGALALSRMKAIVSRLQSIEEMAGIDILCSDKTGTLTQNKLTLGEAECFDAADSQALILDAALASKAEDKDAIDLAVIGGLSDQSTLDACEQSHYVPFDPVNKRTESDIKRPDGRHFKVTKGAPQVILELCQVDSPTGERAKRVIDDLAASGYRTLGVARMAMANAGSSPASCRCSTRRARTPGKPYGRRRRMASRSRWSPATTPPSPAKSPVNWDWAKTSSRQPPCSRATVVSRRWTPSSVSREPTASPRSSRSTSTVSSSPCTSATTW